MGEAPHAVATATAAPEGHHDSQTVPILWLFVCLLLACLTLQVQHRFLRLKKIPFTVALFLEGLIIGGVRLWAPIGPLEPSVVRWIDLEPHLFMHMFLPPLLFAEAMSMPFHDFKRCLSQCMLLAGPGVAIGTLCVGALMYYSVPFGWDWPLCLTLGSILAATDPVAVVAVLKDMGVSRVLTMQIAGESLLNDGIAIAVWTVCFGVVKGDPVSVENFGSALLRIALGGSGVGIVFGFLTLHGISVASDKLSHSDHIVQVSLTISCAYLSFYVAEVYLQASGVLAVIFAGVVISRNGWPLFCAPEEVKAIWHALEFFGNSLVFLLAGVLFSKAALESESVVTWGDWLWLLLIYIFCILSRIVMVSVLFPFINAAAFHGYTATWKDGVVIVWGGLRGAVGLTLALVMAADPQIPRAVSDRLTFFVGGVASLTLIINAPLTGPLVSYLRLNTTPAARRRLIRELHNSLITQAAEKYMQLLEEEAFQDHVPELIGQVIPGLLERKAELEQPEIDLESSQREHATPADVAALSQTWRSSRNHAGQRRSSRRMSCQQDQDPESRVAGDPLSPMVLRHAHINSAMITSLADQADKQLSESKRSRSEAVLGAKMAPAVDAPPPLRDNGRAPDESANRDPPPRCSNSEGQGRGQRHSCVGSPASAPSVTGGRLSASWMTRTLVEPFGGFVRKATEEIWKTSIAIPSFTRRRVMDLDEMRAERELFLSMIREHYSVEAKLGAIFEHSQAFTWLTHAANNAMDFCFFGLRDWKELEGFAQTKTGTWGGVRRTLSKLVGLTRVERMFLPAKSQHEQWDLHTIVCFIDAHASVTNQLTQRTDLGAASEWRLEVIRESQQQVNCAVAKFRELHVDAVQALRAVRTAQLTAMLLQEMRTGVELWRTGGVVLAGEMEELLHPVHEGMKRMANVLKIPAISCPTQESQGSESAPPRQAGEAAWPERPQAWGRGSGLERVAASQVVGRSAESKSVVSAPGSQKAARAEPPPEPIIAVLGSVNVSLPENPAEHFPAAAQELRGEVSVALDSLLQELDMPVVQAQLPPNPNAEIASSSTANSFAKRPSTPGIATAFEFAKLPTNATRCPPSGEPSPSREPTVEPLHCAIDGYASGNLTPFLSPDWLHTHEHASEQQTVESLLREMEADAAVSGRVGCH